MSTRAVIPAKERAKRARARLKKMPLWVRSFVRQYGLNPESVVVKIDTPIREKAVDHFIPHIEHTGDVIVTMTGKRK